MSDSTLVMNASISVIKVQAGQGFYLHPDQEVLDTRIVDYAGQRTYVLTVLHR